MPTPFAVDPAEYSYQVVVESGGVLSQAAFISSKITAVLSPSIPQLTLDG